MLFIGFWYLLFFVICRLRFFMCFFSVCFSEGVIFIVSGVSGSSVEGLVEGSRGFLGFRIFILIIFFIKILLCERLRR